MVADGSIDEWRVLVDLFSRAPAVVLTGAGVSTDSGVPGYRDETGAWLGGAPMQFADFVGSPLARNRYWARSYAGFSRIHEADPNPAHNALARLEQAHHVALLVTQNVDSLHQRAGSKRVMDLHGRLDQVACLSCGRRVSRAWLQQLLSELNPTWDLRGGELRPDGDVELGEVDYSRFAVPACALCGGVLKPDVVFFGERVPPERHQRANTAIASAGLLLVVGSSLVVNSGFRLIRTATQLQVPVVVFNRGVTRADATATLKFEGNAGELLRQLLFHLAVDRPATGVGYECDG